MRHLRPMLATSGELLPVGAEWAHEVKWDGMRVLLGRDDRGVWIRTRSGKDATSSFPEVAAVLEQIAPGLVLDAELLTLVEGRPSFAALSKRLHRSRPTPEAVAAVPVTAMVFDLLINGGTEVTTQSWSDRRGLLTEALAAHSGAALGLSPVYDDGALLHRVTADQGLEGTIAKRRDSPYRAGVRSRDWLKFPHRSHGRFLVGGWSAQEGSSSRLGSVLVGQAAPDGGLIYRGRVGSGVSQQRERLLLERCRQYAAVGSPFTSILGPDEVRGVSWVEPVIEVEVAYLGETDAGRLRQPSLKAVLDA